MKPCPLLPVGSWVVVRPDEPPEMIGSFVLPTSYRSKVLKGKLMAIGPDCQYLDRVGAHVAWKPFKGTEIEMAGQRWLLLEEDHIVAEV